LVAKKKRMEKGKTSHSVEKKGLIFIDIIMLREEEKGVEMEITTTKERCRYSGGRGKTKGEGGGWRECEGHLQSERG